MIAFQGRFSGADLRATLASLGRDVFFVQVGAMDGKSFDPIHDLVRSLGWHGVLLEPVPDLFQKLQENYAGCAGLSFLNMAIADYEGTIEMTRVDPAILQEGVLNETVLGISSLMPDRGVLGGGRLTPELNQLVERYKKSIEVPCSRLPVLLEKLKIPRVDVLVIDTEGADWMVARQLPLETYQPTVVYLEYEHLSSYEKTACAMHFKNYGYRIFLDQHQDENFLALRKK